MRSQCGVENGLLEPPGRGVFDDDPPRTAGRSEGRRASLSVAAVPAGMVVLDGDQRIVAVQAAGRLGRIGPEHVGEPARRDRPRPAPCRCGRGRPGARDRRSRRSGSRSPRRGAALVSLYPAAGAGAADRELRPRRRAPLRRGRRGRPRSSSRPATRSCPTDLAGCHPQLESRRRAAVRVLRRRGDRAADHLVEPPARRERFAELIRRIARACASRASGARRAVAQGRERGSRCG